eukprot:4974925-Pyramimonas_sp.AAC.1
MSDRLSPRCTSEQPKKPAERSWCLRAATEAVPSSAVMVSAPRNRAAKSSRLSLGPRSTRGILTKIGLSRQVPETSDPRTYATHVPRLLSGASQLPVDLRAQDPRAHGITAETGVG